jgi:cytochrome c6
LNDHSRNLRWVVFLTGVFILFSTSILSAQENAALFNGKCVMCHGKDGAGKTPMGAKLKIADLNSPLVQKMTDAELKKIIADGKEKMPPYKAKLTPAQIDSLVAYVRSLKK